AGEVTTLAGRPQRAGYSDGTGADALFYFSLNFATDNVTLGIAVDSAGTIFAADPGNRVIRKITPAGAVTTFGPAAQLFWPTGVAVDGTGNVYVTDVGMRSRVLKAVPDSRLTLVTAPRSQTVAAGSMVVFTVAAIGDSGLTYQWEKDGAPLPGATGSTLIL